MGMSTHVSGVRDLDGRFARMMLAKLACEGAGIGYPKEIANYFGTDADQSEDFLRQEMETVDVGGAVSEFSRVGTYGWQVDLSALPDGVKAIRFENSY